MCNMVIRYTSFSYTALTYFLGGVIWNMIYAGGSLTNYSSSIIPEKHFSLYVESDISYLWVISLKLERKVMNLSWSLTYGFFFRLFQVPLSCSVHKREHHSKTFASCSKQIFVLKERVWQDLARTHQKYKICLEHFGK